jgi:hypothetical protein
MTRYVASWGERDGAAGDSWGPLTWPEARYVLACQVRRNAARAGLPAGTAGKPSAPGTGATIGPALSRRRNRRVTRLVQQHRGPPARPG